MSIRDFDALTRQAAPRRSRRSSLLLARVAAAALTEGSPVGAATSGKRLRNKGRKKAQRNVRETCQAQVAQPAKK
jgi:hypothetical protein